MVEAPVPLTVAALEAEGAVRHGFFSRHGGVGEGLYRSLNCGFRAREPAANVAANRGRAAVALGARPEDLVTANQVHGIAVAEVAAAWPRGAAPTADALVTTRPGIALGLLTADCVPVLLADAGAGVIGAAHAGWRGTRAGVLEAAVEAMVGLGAYNRRIVAAIGPCIRQPSYEVGPELRAAFLDDAPDNDDFFRPGPPPDRFFFDLAGLVRRRLESMGLRAVADSGGDTAAEPGRFFSYRRSRRAGEADFGRSLSAILLVG